MKYLVIIFMHLIAKLCFAQCGMYEISLTEKINESKYIVEGRVTKQVCFKGSLRNKIYTANTIEVLSLFKGSVEDEIIVITEGGLINDEMEIASSLLHLEIGQIGMFFLNSELKEKYQTKENYTVYASAQGFYAYNLQTYEVSNTFHHFNNVNEDFYTLLSNNYQLIKTKEIKSINWGGSQIFNRLTVINNFSPLEINGGVSEQLTINGFGFGNSRGNSNVFFKNANNGGLTEISALPKHYKLWSDTKIIVEVPSKAGSGKIVVDIITAAAQSNQSLKVNYSIINTGSDTSSIIYAPKHIARNSNKGYVWHFNENFDSDSTAKSNFLVSFKQWRCKTFVNWTIDGNTAINYSDRDTINVISFDERNELPAGVLGLCYSYYSGCSEDDWYIEEQDMLFKKSDLWHFGDGNIFATKFDFQSVALHELGHGHQLAHVIDPADLMHYSIAPGVQKRAIESNNLAAASWIMGKSIGTQVCGKEKMQLLDSDLCNDVAFGYFNTTVYPNPFTELLNIDFYLTKNEKLQAQIFDITGKLIASYFNEMAPKGYFPLTFNVPNHLIASGVYVLKVQVGEQKMVRKLIKQ